MIDDVAGEAVAPAASRSGSDAGAKSADEVAWGEAYAVDIPQSYAKYLQDFPQGNWVNEAQRQLANFESSAWTKLQANESIEGYRVYLDVYPGSSNAAVATQKLQRLEQAEKERQRAREAREAADLAAWNAARNEGTQDAMNGYLTGFPQGNYRAEARELASKIKADDDDRRSFSLATTTNTRAAYKSYIDAFPQGIHVADALQALD